MYETISIIEEAAHKAKEIISYLLSYGSHLEKNNFGNVLLNVIINTSLVFIEKEMEIYKIKVSVDIPEQVTIKCNYLEMVQVIKNILFNSKDALVEKKSENKEIRIKSYLVEKNLFLEIWDNGIGIKESNLNKIFDPFFTTKNVGKGMGLGLSMTYDILKKNDAAIEIESKQNEYTKVIIKF